MQDDVTESEAPSTILQPMHPILDLAPDISESVDSGWAAIARTIREVDVQKIGDYKEDIDTLLVFVRAI